MADILSGKSRFKGNKNAPIRRIKDSTKDDIAASVDSENYDIKDIEEKIKRHRQRMILGTIIGIILLVLIIFLITRAIDNYKYKSYTVVNSTNREDIDSSKYVTFADGYIRYSNDGAAYFKQSGNVVWNETYSMQNPQVKVCGSSVAIGDVSGSSIYTFNKNGLVGKVDTSMNITQIEVSSKGMVAAVLEDSYANYINMYDRNGEKVYSVKTTLSGDGFPLDISISEDATKLIASYVRVSGAAIKTNVVFYNFSDVGQNETERVVGGFNYEDVVVGDVKFLNNNIAVAIAENVVCIYRIKEYPSLEKQIDIDSEIQSIFYSEDYLGLILDNTDTGGAYKLKVYDTSGNNVFTKKFSDDFSDYKFDDKSVIMYNSSKMLLYNMSGRIIANLDFDMPVSEILGINNRGSYILINSKYIQKIKLK